MPSAEDERGERLALTALAAASVAYLVVLALGGDRLYFWVDEFQWLTAGSDFAPRTLLEPHASHLIALPRFVYELLPRVTGDSYLPFRILAAGSFMACVWLAFVLLKRRVGPIAGAGAGVLLMFFGSAQEVVISPLGLPFTMATALGLGAFLAIERSDLRGDVGALALLILAGLAHTFGTIAAVGAAAYYLTDRGRRREAWVALVPIALWVAWYLWARQFDQGIASGSNILTTPLSIVEAAGAAVESLIGIGPLVQGALDIPLGLAVIALVVVQVLRRGWTPWLVAYLVTVGAFWFGVGLAESDLRSPDAPRYLFFGPIMVLLIAAESLRGERIPRGAAIAVGAVLAVSLVSNAARLESAFRDAGDRATLGRAQIVPLEEFGTVVDPSVRVSSLGPPATTDVTATREDLTTFADEYGGLGFTPAELLRESEGVRESADFVLVRALDVSAVPVPAAAASDVCTAHEPGDDGFATFPLEPGINLIRLAGDTGEPGAELAIGRYGDVGTVPVGDLEEGRAVSVLIPAGGEGLEWSGRAAGRIETCEAAGEDVPRGRDRRGSRR